MKGKMKQGLWDWVASLGIELECGCSPYDVPSHWMGDPLSFSQDQWWILHPLRWDRLNSLGRQYIYTL